MNTLKDRRQLAEEWIRRVLTYTSEVTWFGPQSLMRAWALATAAMGELAVQSYVALLRRTTLLASSGDALTDLAAERGATRYGAARAKTMVIVQPFTTTFSNVQVGGGGPGVDEIEVADSSGFSAGMSVRLLSEDGATSETATVIAITAGTGLGGGDELQVATLTGTYSTGTVLARVTIAAGASFPSTVGTYFQSIEAVTTGDANPLLAGESTALSLADKVWVEAITAGADGNVDALAINDVLVTGARPTGIVGAYNPSPALGGSDGETDLDLKYRSMHRATLANQETLAWLEALAKEANNDVLRAVRVDVTSAGVMNAKVLHRNGGVFSAAQLAQIEEYIDARVRSYMQTSLANVTLTAVEVEAEITLDPNVTLLQVWQRASARLADFLDFRKWEFGAEVDEADLAALVSQTPGVASMVTSTFLPAANVAPASDSLPTLVRLSLRDTVSGDTINATLAQSF